MSEPGEEHFLRLWPRYRPGSLELGGGGPKLLIRTGLGLLAVAVVMSLPPVVRATNIPAWQAFLILTAYFLCMVFNDYVLHPAAMKGPAGFNAQMAITPLYNVIFCSTFVLIPGDPKTPMWMALLLYALSTAVWQEIDASLYLLALHVVTPLLTIPYFLQAGMHDGWSIAGPVLCAVLSGASYHGVAGVTAEWRKVRRQQAAAIEQLRIENAELDRRRVARDLHDSVGSALSVFGLSADLVEQRANDPEEVRKIAAALREASRDGLHELRGLLDSMAPDTTTFQSLAVAIRRAATRIQDATGKSIEVQTAGEGDTRVDGPVRLTAMRIFQESVNNCLRHAPEARSIEVRLLVAGDLLVLQTLNEGPAPAEGTAGRGLRGISERARELGGTLELAAAEGGRTSLKVSLPLAPPNAPTAAPPGAPG